MRKFFIALVFVVIWGLLVPIGVFAESANKIIELDQKVTVNKDSTIDVEHTTTFLLNGTFHEFYTDYAIRYQAAITACIQNNGLQCAAPTIFQITGARDQYGQEIDPSRYTVSERDDPNGDVFKSFVYSFGSSGKTFRNERFTITIKYRIYGGVGYDTVKNINYIYMNVTPVYNMTADRIVIQNYFPENFTFNEQYFRFNQASTGSSVDYQKEYDAAKRMVQVSVNNFYTDRYLSYQIGFPTNVVDQPANLKVNSSTPVNGLVVTFEGTSLETYQGDTIRGIPTGEHEYTFSAGGYSPKTIKVTAQAGKTALVDVVLEKAASVTIRNSTPESDLTVRYNGITSTVAKGSTIEDIPVGQTNLEFSAYGYVDKTVTVTAKTGENVQIDVVLEETFFAKAMKFAAVVLNCVGLILMPVFILVVYRHWKNKGRDAAQVKVVVPYYHPPEDIRPYLMGSIKDETVDVIDITSTLIDTAYRGFIKIKELPGAKILGIEISGKDYELSKIKDFDTLSENEKLILNGIFDYKERTTISALKDKFYTKVPGIKNGIYNELKDKGYFTGRPDEVRNNYFLLGTAILIFGIFFFIANIYITGVLIYPLFLTISMAVVLAGIATLLIANFMPAKTALGSKIYEQLLGFKMYMEIAERFRVQDLTPETFEKYLSYAMIFGIEKKWGERFKDICKEPPTWFVGSTNTWNTIYMINALSSFNTTTVSALTSSPQSSGTSWGSRGGGWSGGGGFGGGFGGGGIGGGSVGGFR